MIKTLLFLFLAIGIASAQSTRYLPVQIQVCNTSPTPTCNPWNQDHVLPVVVTPPDVQKVMLVTMTLTPTGSPTPTPTFTGSFTYTFTVTNTPTITYTPSFTFSPSPVFTNSFTPTPSFTFTPSYTPSANPSLTFTPRGTLTNTNTPTLTPTYNATTGDPALTATPTPTAPGFGVVDPVTGKTVYCYEPAPSATPTPGQEWVNDTNLNTLMKQYASPTPSIFMNIIAYLGSPVTLQGSSVGLTAGTTILDNNLVALSSPTPSTYINAHSYPGAPITIGSFSAGITFAVTPSALVFNGCVTGVSAGVSTTGTKVTINSGSSACFNVLAAAVTNTGGSGAVDWAFYYQSSPNYAAGTSIAGVTCSGASATAQTSVTIPLGQSCYASIWAITSAATTGVCWLGGR